MEDNGMPVPFIFTWTRLAVGNSSCVARRFLLRGLIGRGHFFHKPMKG